MTWLFFAGIGARDLCADVLSQRGLPHQMRKKTGQFDPGQDSIKVMILHVMNWSRGLAFP